MVSILGDISLQYVAAENGTWPTVINRTCLETRKIGFSKNGRCSISRKFLLTSGEAIGSDQLARGPPRLQGFHKPLELVFKTIATQDIRIEVHWGPNKIFAGKGGVSIVTPLPNS